MKYQILLKYSTGDTFNTYDTEDTLELSWGNLDIAKDNLKRIQEHYKVYKLYSEVSGWRSKYLEKDEVELFESRKTKDWFVTDKDHYTEQYGIKLKADNGNDWQINAFWCGYFEHLESVEIIMDKNVNDLKITF